MTELTDFYRQKVTDFLKTVVCFDDRAYEGGHEGAGAVRIAAKAPDGFSEDVGEVGNGVISGVVGCDPAGSNTGFDEKALTDAFAEMEILCSVIKPDTDGARAKKQIENLARTADVAICDWEFYDDISIAREAIVNIVSEDEKRGGCLRLIVIYSDGNGPDVTTELSGLLEQLGFKYSKDKFELQNAHSLIVFFQKPGLNLPTVPAELVVEYKDLPGRVIDSFTKLTSGLLPAAALSAISVIRQQSHHLLAAFPATLDGAYLTHRCLIPDPNDAEQFFLDLFEGEIGALLAHSRMNEAVDSARCEAWVEKNNIFDASQRKRLRKSLTKYGKAKIDGFRKLFADNNLSDDAVSEMVLELFYGATPNEMERAKEDFSVLSALDTHRRRRMVSEPKMPRLQLGSVVREVWSGRYLLCIQPLCDSTRIKHDKETCFPFLFLDKPSDDKLTKDFDLCVPDGGDGVVWLSILPKPQRLISYQFRGKSVSEAYVVAEKLDDQMNYVFRMADGQSCLEWMADLKTGKAQRIVSQLAARIHTLGIDEFEWLRLHGPRPG